MLSWTFEDSNDLSNFVVLDKRNFIDKNLVKEKNILMRP